MSDLSKKIDIKVLSFDIDNTLIDLDTLESDFTTIWGKFKPEADVLLTYNTGRLFADVSKLIERSIIPVPDYIIGGVGTHIFNYRQKTVLTEFEKVLEEGWNVKRVEEVVESLDFQIKLQPEAYQHAFKRSYFLENATYRQISQIGNIFSASELDVNVIYSGRQYLDILPRWANKGNALYWLLKYLDREPGHALVAGDSGNDLAMFELEGVHGIVVKNAEAELLEKINSRKVYYAQRRKEAGVVEGLINFGLMPPEALRSVDREEGQVFSQKG